MSPIATVIIPHHNDAKRLSRCLASLKQCDNYPAVEIIVIDNGKPALPPNFAAQNPSVKLLYTPTPSAALARNLGVAEASAQVLIFTDSDCQVAPDFLNEALQAASQSDITGGNVILTPRKIGSPNSIEAFEQVFAFNQRQYTQNRGFSVTANMVTTSKLFQHVGPFRAKLSEDYDWGQRATALGYQIAYRDQLIVHHPCRATWPELKRKWQRITQEAYATHREASGSNMAWRARALLMPLSVFAHLPKVLCSPVLSGPRARIGALGVLTRLRIWRMAEMFRVTIRQNTAEAAPTESLWLKPQPTPLRRK